MILSVWKLRVAIQAFLFRLHFPVTLNHGISWDKEDHWHICVAARVLSEDDFVAVCPCHGNCNIEWDDACELCHYFKTLDYKTEPDGSKSITIG